MIEPQERTVSAFEDDVLGDADAVEIARRIAAREIQAHEAVDAAIRRSEKVNPTLNAIVTPLYEEARQAARRPGTGLLAGVPSFIKDTDEVPGAPTRVGSRAVPATPSKKTSSFAKQFLSTGLVNLGKTSTPEFGLTGTTEPALLGPTHNPWRLGFSPGGSSGGSAALVAAGVVPLAHASDGAGSIRIPASCCGLVGLKASRGRVAHVDGSWLLPINILHQGVVSRTVGDTIAFYQAAEAYHRNPKLPPIGTITGPGRRLRIGFFYDPGNRRTAHPEVRASAENAARICEGLGHSVEEVPSPYPEGFHRDFFFLWAMMAFVVTRAGKLLVHPQFDRRQVEPLAEDLSLLFWSNIRGTIPAIRRLRRAAREYHRIFERYDVLLNPTLGTLPPEHGYLGPDVPFKVALKRMGDFFPFTPLQNISGAPAITLPLGNSQSGLPIGVQFASPMGDERTLLELALELEQAAPWPSLNRRVPEEVALSRSES